MPTPKSASKPPLTPSIAIAVGGRPTSGSSSTPLEEGRTGTVDHVVAQIVRGLYEGVYRPGERLVESRLSERYQVGRNTLREALRRLAAEGLVTISLHRGASIRSLSRKDARDVLQVVETLSALAARLAAERDLSIEEAARLRRLLDRLAEAERSGAAFDFGRARNLFYRELASVSGNGELARLMPTIQAHLIRIQFGAAYDSVRPSSLLGGYTEIVEAVLKGDADRSERLMRQHVRNNAAAIARLPDDHFAA